METLKSYNDYIVIFIILLVVLILSGILLIRQWKSKREVAKRFNKNKLLADKLQLINKSTALNYALYSARGERLELVIGGETRDNNSEFGGLLCNNLFENSALNEELIEKLKKTKIIECEIDLSKNYHAQISSEKKEGNCHLIIRELPNNKYKYLSIVIDTENNAKAKLDVEKAQQLFEFAASKSSLGVAAYEIRSKKGICTSLWHSNFEEVQEQKGIIHPKYNYLKDEDRLDINDFFKSLLKGVYKPFVRDLEIVGKNGIKWIREHIFVYKYSKQDNRIYVIDLNYDITDIKETENILIALNQQAEQSRQETDKFLNSISHEVRTPLNSILGFAKLLVSSDSQEDRNEFSDIVNMNLTMLSELISNIIVISELDVDAYKENKEELNIYNEFIEMKQFCENLLAEDKAYKGKKINFHIIVDDKNSTILIDKLLFKHLNLNIITNALKFTESGTIEIRYKNEPKKHCFFIKDNGIGIAPEHQQNIFERFEKIDTFTQGAGLGLALCKTIINKMNGQIGVNSQIGKGSEFWFSIPK